MLDYLELDNKTAPQCILPCCVMIVNCFNWWFCATCIQIVIKFCWGLVSCLHLSIKEIQDTTMCSNMLVFQNVLSGHPIHSLISKQMKWFIMRSIGYLIRMCSWEKMKYRLICIYMTILSHTYIHVCVCLSLCVCVYNVCVCVRVV